MTDSEKLDLLLSKIGKIDTLESELQGMKNDIQELTQRVINVELHLENITDHNIQLLAENFIVLTDKLNEAIPAANKNLAYEVKVNYLVKEVDKMKEEMIRIKNQTA